MCRLGLRFEDSPAIGWDCVLVFARHLDSQSAVYRAQHPEEADFASPLKRAAILADIFDAIRGLEYTFVLAHLKKGAAPPPEPRKYPRPGVDDGVQRIGKDAIPISDFEEWYYGGDA